MISVEEFCSMELPCKRAELHDGTVHLRPSDGHFSNRVEYRFVSLFADHCRARMDLEFARGSDAFLLQRDPDLLLSPNASLFRLSKVQNAGRWLVGAPDIAVEVLSPSNGRTAILYKIRKYFAAGGAQVWIADPVAKTLEIYFWDQRHLVAKEDAVVTAEAPIEGLRVDLAAVFAQTRL